MSLGENIKKYRTERKMTQKQLSELVGVAEITIRQYESGKRSPKAEHIFKISNVLKVPLSTLYCTPVLSDEGKDVLLSFGKESILVNAEELQKALYKYSPSSNISSSLDDNELHLLSYFHALDDNSKYEFLDLCFSYSLLNTEGHYQLTRLLDLLLKIPEYLKKNEISSDNTKE